ncbi:hypothetical protein ACHAXT_010121 [Thalassiosira profunda]
MKPLPTGASQLQLLSFYRFAPIHQPEIIRDVLFERLETIEGLRGTVYIAEEGINAQFAVPVGGDGEPLEDLMDAFKNDTSGGCLPFDAFDAGNSPNMGNVVDIDTPTFDRLIVRTRDAILRDGMNLGEGVSLDWSDTGEELDPAEWDEQLRQPDIQLLDCRNSYESDQGSFISAKPLNTQAFSDTWSVLDNEVESKALDPSKPVHIFCTGGIRCVKVGSYLRQELGFDDVRSLRHGIIGYQRWSGEGDKCAGEDETESEDANTNAASLWEGQNFLFDKRRFAESGQNETEIPE